MGYNELPFLFGFLPLALLLFSITPRAKRKYILTFLSWTYFTICSRYLLVWLIGTTLFIYIMGLWIGKVGDRIPENYEVLMRKGPKEGSDVDLRAVKKEHIRHKTLMLVSVLTLFGVLLVLKYTGFFVDQLNGILASAGKVPVVAPKLLVPVGLSFYTLEAVGYILEVYWKRIPAEHDFWAIALLIGFFPQTMEGPIARYGDTAKQFIAPEPAVPRNLQEMTSAAMRIVWGMFKKIVIADRLNTVVAYLFDNYQDQNGVMIVVAAVSYTVQLYMEFSGMMDVVIGSARLFGIRLPENFRQPFFSQTASEFWRRWHITLGAWLKDYLFYPVAASRFSKDLGKKVRKKHGRHAAKLATSALALTPVWLFNGLWHGAGWHYIFYGIYYLALLLLEQVIDPARDAFYKKTGINRKGKGATLFRILRTWLIIFTGELFFRADTMGAGLHMFGSMFKNFGISRLFDGTLLHLGIEGADWIAVILGTVVVFIYDVLIERGFSMKNWIWKQKLPVRWLLYYALIVAVIMFGAYGTGYEPVDLIYAGF